MQEPITRRCAELTLARLDPARRLRELALQWTLPPHLAPKNSRVIAHLRESFLRLVELERQPLSRELVISKRQVTPLHLDEVPSHGAKAHVGVLPGPLALSKPEDVVIGLTTSGTSPNINLGLEAANKIGAYTVAFTGRDGGKVKDIANLPIIIENNITARIQEAHMFIGHWLCEAIDELVTQD